MLLKDFIFTIDVETLSFETHSSDNRMITKIENFAIPALLEIFRNYNIKATFLYTAEFAKLSSDSIIEVIKHGHEIGIHGLDHSHYYDKMSLSDQLYSIKKAKDIVECKINRFINSFRAPFLRINSDTIKALELLNFKVDSSIASKRCDFMFTTAPISKLRWLGSPMGFYHPSRDNPFRHGQSGIMEIPVSSFIWSLTGTHLRISDGITKALTNCFIASNNIVPIVFLIHPNEFISCKKGKTTRSGNIFQDNIRHFIKIKDLGLHAFEKLISLIRMIKENVNFISLGEFYEKKVI